MQHTLFLLAFAGVVALTAPTKAQTSTDGWKRVYDPEIGVSVDYPEGVFNTYSGATDRYPGKRFLSSEGRAEFAYYAFENKRRDTPSSYLNRTLVVQQRQLVYTRITDRFFVISSVRNERIFYSRCNFGPTVKCIYLEYPASEKRAWDRAVTRISYSLG